MEEQEYVEYLKKQTTHELQGIRRSLDSEESPERYAAVLDELNSRKNNGVSWICPKCGGETYETASISMTGGLLSRIFNFQGHRFTVITCFKCKYSEFYRVKPNELADVLDIVLGG